MNQQLTFEGGFSAAKMRFAILTGKGQFVLRRRLGRFGPPPPARRRRRKALPAPALASRPADRRPYTGDGAVGRTLQATARCFAAKASIVSSIAAAATLVDVGAEDEGRLVLVRPVAALVLPPRRSHSFEPGSGMGTLNEISASGRPRANAKSPRCRRGPLPGSRR